MDFFMLYKFLQPAFYSGGLGSMVSSQVISWLFLALGVCSHGNADEVYHWIHAVKVKR